MCETISILLVIGNPTLRFGSRTVLEQEPDLDVQGDVEDGEEDLVLIERLRPDVALLDSAPPRSTAIRVAREGLRRRLPTRFAVFCDRGDVNSLYRLVMAGVTGYLVADEAPENIVAAVRATRNGEGWFSPTLSIDLANYRYRFLHSPASGCYQHESCPG